MKKKELAIVLGITGNWAFALANTLIGLKKHNPDLKADIVVYYDAISLRNRIALQKIYPIIFKKYDFPFKNDSHKINNINIFKEISFCCYECFGLLKDYKKVIWFDVDILIQKSIDELINLNPKSGIAMYTNPDISAHSLREVFTQDIEGYNIDINDFASGTIVLNDNLKDYHKLVSWCYEKTIEYAPFLVYPDQGIINLMLQEFDISPEWLDLKFVYHPNFSNPENAVILHAFCPEKFWSGIHHPEWEENNRVWLQYGGSAFDKKWDFMRKPNIFRQPSKYFKDFVKRYLF